MRLRQPRTGLLILSEERLVPAVRLLLGVAFVILFYWFLFESGASSTTQPAGLLLLLPLLFAPQFADNCRHIFGRNEIRIDAAAGRICMNQVEVARFGDVQ